MSREAAVVRSLVEMAETLVDDYDIVDLLTGLADRCVNVLGVSAAGVMLASPEGGLGLVASSSEAMRLLELFELQAQEGPCLDAFRTGERVEHEDLAAGSGRWPSFSTAAFRAGFQSVSALPLRWRDMTLGALNLFSVTQAPMGEADVIVARAFADLATVSIVQHRATAEAQRLNEQLSGALTSPGRDRAGQGRDLRAGRGRSGRGLRPVAQLRPQQQPAPHRCRRSRHRRHPRPAGMGPARPSGLLTTPGPAPGRRRQRQTSSHDTALPHVHRARRRGAAAWPEDSRLLWPRGTATGALGCAAGPHLRRCVAGLTIRRPAGPPGIRLRSRILTGSPRGKVTVLVGYGRPSGRPGPAPGQLIFARGAVACSRQNAGRDARPGQSHGPARPARSRRRAAHARR